MKQFLQNNFGELSSKRLAGIFCILIGGILKIKLIIYGINHPILNFNDLDDAADMLLYIGSGLLGAGLFEGLRKK